MKKRTGIIIQVICFAIFTCCAIYLGKYFYDSRKAQNEMSQLQQSVEDNTQPSSAEDLRAANGMLQSYYDLYTQNNDLTGWIKIEDTKINYPVMISDNNEEYLHKNFEKQYQSCGLPFMDYQCDPDKPSDNVIIYAHNMKNGSMFAALTKYSSEDFYKSHSVISFDTLYQRGTYEIVYAFRTKASGGNEFRYHDTANFGNEEDFEEFANHAKSLSFYDTGKSIQYGDKLLTLSTCSYNTSDERFVVIAKKID